MGKYNNYPRMFASGELDSVIEQDSNNFSSSSRYHQSKRLSSHLNSHHTPSVLQATMAKNSPRKKLSQTVEDETDLISGNLM
jgi:hypothetical protein